MQGVISSAIRSEQRQEPHDTENTAILKHNKVLNNYNTTCERQFMKKKRLLDGIYIPMSTPDSFLKKILLKAPLSQFHVNPDA